MNLCGLRDCKRLKSSTVNQTNNLTSQTPSSLLPPAHSLELVMGRVPLWSCWHRSLLTMGKWTLFNVPSCPVPEKGRNDSITEAAARQFFTLSTFIQSDTSNLCAFPHPAFTMLHFVVPNHKMLPKYFHHQWKYLWNLCISVAWKHD